MDAILDIAVTASCAGFVLAAVCVVASFIRSGQISEMERKHGKES